jgi:hypothetical protein
MKIVVLLLLLLAASPPQEKKLPVPDAAAQRAARTLIREVYRNDFANKGPTARADLVGKLLELARQTNDDPAGRYMLYIEARDLQAEAANFEGIRTIVEEMATIYAVDIAALKADAVAILVQRLKTDVETSDAARQLLVMAADELDAERLDSAQKAVDQASALAKKVKDLPMAAKADAKSREIAERRQRLETIRQARELLARLPNDPAANLTVGRHECFVKGAWEAGLPLLARGSDAGLRSIADKDLKTGPTADAQAATANSWWELAEAEKDPAVKRRLRTRAGFWYEKAESAATGLQKTLVARRLAEIRGDRIQGTWVDYTDPRIFLLGGKAGDPIVPDLEGQPGRLITLEKWPAGEYDGVSVRIRRGFPKEGAGAALLFDPNHAVIVEPETGQAAVLSRKIDDMEWRRELIVKVDKKDAYELLAALSAGHWLIHIDGKEILRLPTRRTVLGDVGLQIQRAVFSFDQFKLRKKN